MPDTTHNLILDYKDPDGVIFRRGDSLDDSHWKELLNWWSNGAKVNYQKSQYEITFADFLNKKSWFKFGWQDKGRSLYISDTLRVAVKDSRKSQEEFEAAAGEIKNTPIENLDSSHFVRNPTHEQEINIAAGLKIANGANFSVPGAGKTMTTLIIWDELRRANELDKLLVIAPKSAFEAWAETEPEEIFAHPPNTEIFSPPIVNLSTDILITNYEKLENQSHLNILIEWSRKNSTMLVLDEAHRVKGGGKSVRWVACKQLADFSKRVELLTGTPMPQGYDDMRNLLKLAWRNLPTNYLTDVRIKQLSPGGIFVRTTKDELGLPPIKIKEIEIEPTPIQSQIYSALKKNYAGTFRFSRSQEEFFSQKGKAIMTLIAAASNPGLLAGKFQEDAYLGLRWPPVEISSDKNLLDTVYNYASSEIPSKYKWITKFIEKSSREGKKTLLWSNFVGNLLSLKKLLKPYSPALIYGAVSEGDRAAELQRFKSDPKCSVLITNPQTLGEGISLHKVCHQAIYLDRTYNAGQYLQSLDRIHRLGLAPDTETTIYVLTSRHMIDDRIHSRLSEKIYRMSEILNDKSLSETATLTLGDSDDKNLLGLDNFDLDDLYQHLRSND